ncbi:tyrosine-type recombinase/integrase [Salibaculum griseiflavum]|uniref:tyrosine-type recombinase/integrase n=1 Tax=Salibaculum griseiflavum TaxID=1914409 RepID=UPI001C389F30|nr:integrase family protein [Salibaculum griseiflavum]
MSPTKITQRTLASIEATGKRHFIRDKDLTGFGIAVTAKGKASYFVETRIRGLNKVIRKQLGSVDHLPLEDARQEARKHLLEAKRGKDIRFSDQEDEPLPDTLGAALESHLKAKQHSMRPSTTSDYKKTFNNALSDWRDLPTKQLSRGMIAKRYNELLGRYSGAYVDKIFRNLSSTLAFHGIAPNPCKVISDKGLKAPLVARERALTPREIHIVWQEHATFKPPVTRILLFYMLTGLRRSEVLNLTWADIYGGHARIRQPKNHQPHVIPLTGILKTLAGERGEDEQRVFGYTTHSLRTAFDKFKQRVKFHDDWTIHDLRRTFSADLQLLGYSEAEIGIALNHAAGSVTGRHYRGRTRNKSWLLSRMYTDLQTQHSYYQYNDGDLDEVRPMPKDWEPYQEPEI